jgi:CBS domain-containing protein
LSGEADKLQKLREVMAAKYMRPVSNVIDAETPIWKVMEMATYSPGRHTYLLCRDGKPIGMITIHKILKWILLKTRELKDLAEELEVEFREVLGVRAIDFAEPPATIAEDATVTDAAREMVRRGVDTVWVLSANGEVLGELDYMVIMELALKEIAKT